MLLTDLTLMDMALWEKPPDRINKLYEALIRVGLKVQIPVKMMKVLQGSLLKAQTVLWLDHDDQAEPGFAGYIFRDGRTYMPGSIMEIPLGAVTHQKADEYRLLADGALFLSDRNWMINELNRMPGPVTLCARGNRDLATALTVDWLMSLGFGAAVSFLGSGGYASLAEVVMALYLKGDTSLCPAALRRAADAWEEMTGEIIPPHQPVVGKRIFDVLSGVHVDGLLKDKDSYEPFAPETVGASRRILLGRPSGTSAVICKLHSLGIDADQLDISRLLVMVRELGETKEYITDEEVLALAATAKKEVSV